MTVLAEASSKAQRRLPIRLSMSGEQAVESEGEALRRLHGREPTLSSNGGRWSKRFTLAPPTLHGRAGNQWNTSGASRHRLDLRQSQGRLVPLAQREGKRAEARLSADRSASASVLRSDWIFEHFFLQPMDGPNHRENLDAAARYCLAHPPWRLSLQTHKLIGIR